MDWSSASEIVCGLVLQGRLAPQSVKASNFEAPYDIIVRLLQQDKDESDILGKVGLQPIATCEAAADRVGTKEDLGKYLTLLEQTALYVEVGAQLEKYAKQLMKGQEVDVSKALSVVTKLDTGQREFTTMDQVEPEKNLWKSSYYPAWDFYFQGIPPSGLILVGAPPGTGKTTLVLKLIDGMTQDQTVTVEGKNGRKRKVQQKGQEVGMFSLELPNPVLLTRWIQTNESLTLEQRAKVHTTDETYTLDEMVVAISRMEAEHPNIYCYFIDFADLMIPEEREESVEMAGLIYRRLAALAKRIRKPIILLCQLNSNYIGGIPKVNHIRWSRLAEAVATMIVLICNQDQLFVDMGQKSKAPQLPYVEGKAYLILGKSRFGHKMGSIGAIQLDWMGAQGWGDEGEWYKL